jgi:hypothetical protein
MTSNFEKAKEVVPKTFEGYPVRVEPVAVTDLMDGTPVQHSGSTPTDKESGNSS